MQGPDRQIIDCHTHLFSIGEIDGFLEIMADAGVSAINLLVLANPIPPWWAKPGTPDWHRRWFPRDVTVNAASMMFKALHPNRVYVFGGLDHNTSEVLAGDHNYANQAQALIEMGVDGFKMWEGGFALHEQTGLALDAGEYEEYYALLESESLPILYHVSADYRHEVERVLAKHPNLKIILAHFYGGSRDLDRLRLLFDTWENVYVDLAPGMLIRGLSEERDQARVLFTEYQDRILFGTDASATTPQSVERGKLLVRFIRRLLERDDDLDLEEIGVFEPDLADPSLSEPQRMSRHEFWADRGLHLDDSALDAIYRRNFVGIAGASPRQANPRAALTHCEALIDRLEKDARSTGADECEDDRGERSRIYVDELEQIASTFRERL